MVRMAATYRIPEDEIVKVVTNPKTGQPISETTLKKHFRKELNESFVQGRLRLMAATYRNALGETKVGQNGQVEVIKEGNVTAQIWLGKVLYGLKEPQNLPPPPPPPTAEENFLDAARRLAFTLYRGSQMAPAEPAKPKKLVHKS